MLPFETLFKGEFLSVVKPKTLKHFEDYEIIQDLVKKESYYEENVITSINNPGGRIKFKDIRKVSIGISKKDIMSYRSKKKSAFYNCFVIIFIFIIQCINKYNTYKNR